jgi:AcrR family transcriptional regulator
MSSSRTHKTQTPPYHHGNLRQALLDGARVLVAEEGLEALTLRAVARRIGVSTAAPYHHFQSRAEVIQALARENLEFLDAASRQAIEAHDDTPTQLRELGMMYIMYAVQHPADFRLMFRPELSPPPTPQNLETAPVFRVLLDVLRRGDVHPERLEVTALAVWSLVHGLATLLVDGPLQAQNTDLETVRTLVMQITRDTRFAALEPRTP